MMMLLAIQLKAQLFIPLFEPPQKVEVLSNRAEESSAVTFNKGEAMFFNRSYVDIKDDGGKIKAQDAWFAEQGKKGWKTPFRAFRDLDGDQIELFIGCSEDGEKLYLLNRYFVKGKDSIASRIVYKTRNGRSTWKDPVEIPVPGLDLSDQHMTIFMHSSGEVLLISKLTEDDTPNEDIYLMHKKENGTWSELIDLGPRINTKDLEFSPFLTHDKKALYFASNGHKGFGESDIFVSFRKDDSWSEWTRPMNLGLPINSEAFEASFIISDSANVYFTSDRNSDNTDIYHTKSTGEYKVANEGVLLGEVYRDRQPLRAAKLNVYDSNGNFIEKVMTDDEGKFKFVKLQAEDSYKIEQDTIVEENLAGAILYVVDGKGGLKKRLVFTEEGEAIDAKNSGTGETVYGKFLSEGQPMLNTAMVILDENGFPIDTVYTNDKGEFSYQKLAADKEIFVNPRDIPEDEYDDFDLYLTDKDGNKTKVFIGEEIAGTVFGKFNYKELPLVSTAIVVLDEDGLPIDTIFTDANGKFKYVKLNPEDEVTFALLNTDDFDMADLSLDITDKEGKKLQTLAFDKSSAISQANADDEAAMALKMANEAKAKATSMAAPKDIIVYFDYNKSEFDTKSGKSLNEVVKTIKNFDGTITLVGHTDSKGSDQYNQNLSVRRANTVKKLFIKNGVKTNKIKVSGKGETSPVATNDTEEGRAKNRRVEVRFKL